MRFTIHAAVMAAIVIVACPAAAQETAGKMYSWTDENGVVHFSDKKPPGRDIEPEDLPTAQRPGSVSPQMPGTTESQGQSNTAQQRREEIADARQLKKEQRALLEQQCASMRDIVARLEPHRRVYYTNEQGETERMDDVERVNRVAEAKRFIEENCRGL